MGLALCRRSGVPEAMGPGAWLRLAFGPVGSDTLAARGPGLTSIQARAPQGASGEGASSEHEGRSGEAAAPSPDPGLILAVASGDRDALAQLYDRYSGLMLGLGIKVLRNRREAEDLVHDVFLEVWRRAHTYDPSRASVRSWLLLMMRCRALDRRKSHGFALSSPLEHDPRVAPQSDSPAVALDRARVVAALEQLPEPQRAVLVLGYFEGLSSSEIAERLSLPIGTVKSRVAVAMRALRERLGVDPGAAGEGEP